MFDHIHIIGAGAIGGLIGAHLTKKLGKSRVTLVDNDPVHVDAIRERGLKILDEGVRPAWSETVDVEITNTGELRFSDATDIIVAVKAYSNGDVLPHLSKEANLLVLQNGWDERLNSFANAVRSVEFGFACKVDQPGLVFNAVKGRYLLGTCDGNSEKAEPWAELLSSAGIDSRTAENITGYVWSKVLVNSCLNPVSAIFDYSFGEVVGNERSRQLFRELYLEGYPVIKRHCRELGQKPGSLIGPPGLIYALSKSRVLSDCLLKAAAGKFGDVESSMLQDVRRDRPTEIDFINGQIIALGKRLGMDTPKNKWIYDEIKKMEPHA